MQTPVLVSYPRVAPSEKNGYAHSALATNAQPHALTAASIQHKPPYTTFIQPMEHAASAVFTPPTPSTFTPTVFPPEDIPKTHTTPSYSKDPIPELVNSDRGHWTFSLDVPIPDEMIYPILTSLEYTVKYGTRDGRGISTIQTNVLLAKIPDASLDANSARSDNGVISTVSGAGFYPQMLDDGVPVVCLSSVPAVRENCPTSQLDHYIGQQQLLPHVRIIEDSRLYLQLHVIETPSPLMLRSLVVDVSATWVEDMQGKRLHDKIEAVEARIKVAEQKQAEEEQARLQAERKSAEANRAKEIAEQMEQTAKKKSEYDQLAKKQADQQANTDRLAKQQADELAETYERKEEAAYATAQSNRTAKEDADRQAAAEHQAEVEADTRAQKDREARSAIEHQL
ncbi:hypothetical protein AZE42_03003 [Rhizopogon vesiculosus]|uniref:Uncharacterized protein n=1 Tax=Rhizopogon vesiculosus TaxID=180088 RepID=A0A1J8R7C1_9AGAM|nr:hypothetical protein AZE42_03003 [Rhizopogon vesiculosus]